MKLFAVYVGGEAPGANIELHDMRFVVAETIEQTYDELRRQWWGTPKSLHLDAWVALTRADGHHISLEREPQDSSLKFYYVNVGGYEVGKFTELHENLFVVAESEQKAKVRALKQVKHWDSFHKDDLYEAEQCYDLAAMLDDRWHIHLTAGAPEGLPEVTGRYMKIGR